MTDFEVAGVLELDSDDYVGGADEAASASEDLAESADSTAGSLFELEPAGQAAAAGIAGIGAAATGALQSTAGLRETAALTAGTVGTSRQQIRGLATDLSNVTFSTEEASRTLDILSQHGVESEGAMRDAAASVDVLATSTGNQADVVAEQALPTLAAYGDSASDITGLTDEFSFAVRNSALDMRDLTMSLRRGRREGLGEMVGGTKEAIGLLAAFQQETGLVGRDLRREFSQQLREADGDLQAFTEATGVGREEMQQFQESVPEGFAEGLASDVGETKTLVDELKVTVSDLTLQFAGLAEPVNAAAPAVTALSTSVVALNGVSLAAIPSVSALAASVATLALPLAAVGAAIVGLAVIWKRDIGGIQDKTAGAVEFITGSLGGLADFLSGLVDSLNHILFEWDPRESLAGIKDDILGALPSAQDMIDRGQELMQGLADGIINKATAPVDAVAGVADDIGDRLPSSPAEEGALSTLDEMGAALPETLADNMEANAPAVERAAGDVAAAARPGGAFGADIVDAIRDVDSGGDSGGPRTPAVSVEGDGPTMDGRAVQDSLRPHEGRFRQGRQRNGP